MPMVEAFLSHEQLRLRARWRRVGLVLAPLLSVAVWALCPENMSQPASALLALVAGTLVLWLSEALPLGVTALAAPGVGVLLGVATPEAMFAPFAHPVVFLFLGAAFLHQAAQWRRLDRAAAAALFPRGRTTLRRLVWALSAAAAALSSLAPNRSVAALLVPVVDREAQRFGLRFERLGLLGVAWCANIGGMATAVGAPANLVAIAALAQYDGREVPLLHWSLIALPVVLCMLALWAALARVVLGPDGLQEVHGDLRTNGPRKRPPTTEALRLADTVPLLWGLDRGQAVIAVVTLCCVALWFAPGVVALFAGIDSDAARATSRALPPGVVALLGAAVLFAAPAGQKRNPLGRPRTEPVLTWEQAAGIDWDVVLLLGCGLALGHQMIDTGLSRWLGHLAVKGFAVESQLGLAALMAALALALTQIASDTVTAAVLCPLAVVAAQQLNVSPAGPCLAVGMAASVAVLLPLSTDTSAIVHAYRKLTWRQMAKRGVFAIIAAGVLIPLLCVSLATLLGLG